MILNGPGERFLLKYVVFHKLLGFSENLQILPWFQLICWKTHKFHAARTGRAEPAQTLKNLRNYIGFGEGNQLGEQENQPRSPQNHDFRTSGEFLVNFQRKLVNLVIFSDFQHISLKYGTSAAMCWNACNSYGILMVLDTRIA